MGWMPLDVALVISITTLVFKVVRELLRAIRVTSGTTKLSSPLTDAWRFADDIAPLLVGSVIVLSVIAAFAVRLLRAE